jgi:hypothetical protein
VPQRHMCKRSDFGRLTADRAMEPFMNPLSESTGKEHQVAEPGATPFPRPPLRGQSFTDLGPAPQRRSDAVWNVFEYDLMTVSQVDRLSALASGPLFDRSNRAVGGLGAGAKVGANMRSTEAPSGECRRALPQVDGTLVHSQQLSPIGLG